MKKYSFILVSVAVISCSIACNKTEIAGDSCGYLYVDLDKDTSEDIVFKSTPEELDLVFALDVISSRDTVHVDDYRELSDSPLKLPAGNFEYTAVAYSGEDMDAVFDVPFYRGRTAFRVKQDEITNVSISCSLANVKVTAEFADDIREKFTRYRLTVTNGPGTLVFDSAPEVGTIGREGYFSVTGTLSWELKLFNKDGKEYSVSDTYTDVREKQHYNLTFSLAEEDEFGGGAFSIILNDSMNEKEYDLVLDFGDETKPEMTADFDWTEPVYVVAGDDTRRTLTLVSEDGFKSIVLEYGDAVSKASSVSYELVGATTDVLGRLAGDGVVVASVPEGAKSVSIDITSYVSEHLSVGQSVFDVFMVDVNNAFSDETIVFDVQSSVDVEAVSADAWARFATVSARWYTEVMPEGISFRYRKSSDSGWTDFDGVVIPDAESRTYSAELHGLEPDTEYRLKAVTADENDTREISFRTGSEEIVPNMNFDSWFLSGKAWYPDVDLSESHYIWDSANGGTAALGTVPTVPEEEDVAVSGEGKKAARLVSSTAFGQFAAGNIYTGRFGKATLSPLGATLQWGVPFTGRPLALRGWYKYRPVKVDKGNHNGMSGKTDICQIQIMLADWNAPFDISTGDGRFVDVNGSDILAYGSFESSETMDEYRQFTIRLDYRDVSRTPKYIVIVAAASKYGDYFTGGVGSTLLLDEFEFIYDPEKLDN